MMMMVLLSLFHTCIKHEEEERVRESKHEDDDDYVGMGKTWSGKTSIFFSCVHEQNEADKYRQERREARQEALKNKGVHHKE